MTAHEALPLVLATAVLLMGVAGRPRRPRADLMARSSSARPPRVRRPRPVPVVEELPDVVDLLRLGISAGLTVPLALRTVADHGEGTLAEMLGRAHERSTRGVALVDALDEVVVVLGEDVRRLVRVLASSLRDGTASAPALERLADEVRLDRRRGAEIRARRLSVRLLFPLVLCVLPAFGLLTVVPLLAGSLRDLPW